MIIGNFTYDPDKDTYRGTITTLTAGRADVLIRPVRKGGEREPDYRVEHSSGRDSVELGAAWKRTSDKTGDFLSIVLDDPVLPTSINAALFHDKPPSSASRLVWTRPQTKRPAAEPEPQRPEASPPRAASRRKPQHG